MSCEKVFLEKIRSRGFRLTPQREIVLSVMHQIEGLATADEIYARVCEVSTSLDISTIYRTLDLLQEFHLVTWVDTGDGVRRYELLGVHGPHLHLVCQSCGAVLGVESGEVGAFADYLRTLHGFEVNLDAVTIPGVCQKCRTVPSETLMPAGEAA